ncbi:ABC transporter substrate-binding protein [Paenibacillus hemerocallicola]|nr:extracellular solute-binding protein [Paenibacillus hemerocallicola]
MNKIKQAALLTTFMLSVGTVLAGCGDGPKEAAPAQPAEINKPVTITVFNPSNYSEYLWNNLWVEPIKKKYPHITLVHIKNEKGSSLADLVLANRVPDIIQGSGVKSTFEYNDLGILDDMTPLMKANGFDPGGIDPISMDNLKIDKKDAKIYGLPVGQGHAALYYNKDLFNKFGVAYPKDGMNWDEVYELTKKMTRTDGGVKYRGFDFVADFQIPYNQLSLPFIDNKTDKANVQTDGWKTLFAAMKKFYDIDGNNPGALPNVFNPFLKDKTVAMFAVPNILSPLIESTQNGLDWDMVTLPTFASGPKTGIQPVVSGLYVSKTSQNKNEAFKVVAHLLSEEIQTERSRIGEPSILKKPEIKNSFATEMPHTKGRNVVAFVSGMPAPSPSSVTKYDALAGTEMVKKFKEVAFNGKDINTALREAEEIINKKIDEEKAKK